MSEHGWKTMLRGNPSQGRLQAALFTTYDRPDERVLVEHLLPSLLDLERSLGGDGTELRSFYGELARRLETLAGKIVIVSSMPQPSKGIRAYPWLWRFVQSMHVGRHVAATQHAKVWLLHWGGGADASESLEVVVSSANLTMGAMRDQVQAVWRKTIPLESGASQARLRSWGVFPRFLELLGQACGAEAHVSHFIALLRHCERPEQATFLASVPGTHTRAELRRSPWGSAALEELAPPGTGRTRVQVTVPYVGTWRQDALTAWCESAGGDPKTLALLWLDKHHPWARRNDQPNWRMPKQTLKTLVDSGSSLLQLKPDTALHSQHRAPQDPRWSHAKLYHLRRGRSERLIITSANFSPAAWGAPSASGLTIRNFELGVCLDKTSWPVDDANEFEDSAAAFTITAEALPTESVIAWADACWDGREITIRCRVRDEDRPEAELLSASDKVLCCARSWKASSTGELVATIPWSDFLQPPAVARLSASGALCEVGVRDLRPPDELGKSPLPEMNEADSEALRDRLLLEDYGYYARPGDDVSPENGVEGESLAPPEDNALPAANYTVEAFEIARDRFNIVDEWARRVELAMHLHDGGHLRKHVLADGEQLVVALLRHLAPGARSASELPNQLAADELSWRVTDAREQLEQEHG